MKWGVVSTHLSPGLPAGPVGNWEKRFSLLLHSSGTVIPTLGKLARFNSGAEDLSFASSMPGPGTLSFIGAPMPYGLRLKEFHQISEPGKAQTGLRPTLLPPSPPTFQVAALRLSVRPLLVSVLFMRREKRRSVGASRFFFDRPGKARGGGRPSSKC